MPKPENILTTSAPASYADMLHKDLLAEVGKRGLDLGPGYHPKPDLVAALEADDAAHASTMAVPVVPGADLGAAADIIPADQPEHRQDANQPRAPRSDEGGALYLSRTHLVRMAQGEVVDVCGVHLAADPVDFPAVWKLR
jgi:hypothetical protein